MAEPSIQKNTSNDPNSPKENSTSSSSSWPTEMHPLSQNNSQKPPLPAAAAAANDSSQKQNTTPARPTKRQKVSLACQECRSRKTKCDGVRPVCGSCAKKPRLEGSCVYEPERGKRGIKNQ